MSAGDIYIRKNVNDTSAVPNAGSGNEDSGWDTVVSNTGNIVTYTDPYFQLDTGLYLIMYSERFYTSDTTLNERIEIQGEIHVNGTGVVGGYGSDYIRKTSGQQDCIVSGYMFLQVTSDNTDVFIRFYRTDNSTTGTVNRVPGYGGVNIVEMDDTNHNFCFVSTSSSEATSGTTERTLALNTSDKVDSGFSLSSNQITVSNAGRYLVTYSMDISMTATVRENVRAWLRKNSSTKITGTQSHSYLRGVDGNQDSALTWIGIIDLSANDVIDVRWDCPSSQTITCASGAKLQMWQIPSAGDTCIVEATTGDYNTTDETEFEWDTNPQIDTASFTHTAGNSNVDVDQRDNVLTFATFSQTTDSTPQRAYPLIRIKKGNTTLDYNSGGAYQRNSGTYGVAVTVAGIVTETVTNESINITTVATAEIGALANISGQFSLLSLESIWNYAYNPTITDMEDEQIDDGETDNVITGESFGSTQGNGKVELWSDLSGTIKVEQTIDSWSDTSIQFDSVKGTLSDGHVYVVVTTDSSLVSNKYAINLGLKSYTTVITDLKPDHYWILDNDYDDSGITGPDRPMTSGVVGTQVFTTSTIAEDSTYCVLFNDINDAREIVDSPNMNTTNSIAERTMGGWIEVGDIQQSLGSIYKEGGSVQNLAFLMGIGNVLIAQMADSDAGNNVQAWSDFRLEPNRPYHIIFRYSQIENPEEFRLFIDGIEQTNTNGNPITGGKFTTHVGDVGWGDPDNTLETGGTDIAYAGKNSCKYSHWATWSDFSTNTNAGALDKTTEIKKLLFERGAKPDVKITSNTQSNMQTALNAYSNTERPNAPLAIRIERKSGYGDLELVADNITFDDNVSLQIQWYGTSTETLTWVNKNGSVVDTSKFSTPNNGTITIIEQFSLKITVKDIETFSVVQDATVLLKAGSGGDLPYKDSVTITRSESVVTVSHTSHGLITNNKVLIEGSDQDEYNGIHTITVTNDNTYTYTITGTPQTPATGTITSTSVLISGKTNSSGIITSDHRYSSEQPVSGYVRSASGTIKYIQSNISGSIRSSGYDEIIYLIRDM